MDQIGKLLDFGLRYVFEPGLNWVLDHPIISLLIVVGLVYWAARGYKML
jgi:hypothetical protein